LEELKIARPKKIFFPGDSTIQLLFTLQLLQSFTKMHIYIFSSYLKYDYGVSYGRDKEKASGRDL